MRKLWLTFTAMLFCSIASFAQTEIWTKADFEGMSSSGNYILKADINLGDYGERSSAIIESFSGTFDGNGNTITYQASFLGNSDNGSYGLFGTVNGTIENLNVNANITFGGTNNNMQVGLLCGLLNNNGTIQLCNVTGNINSTVSAGNGGGTDAGLVAGQSLGQILYCAVTGNVTGIGYVGGIVGHLGSTTSFSANIRGCSFTGNVKANQPNEVNCDAGLGSFAGGICGFEEGYWVVLGEVRTSITLCCVNANIYSSTQTHGVASSSCAWSVGGNVTNSYASGNVNDNLIDTDDEISNGYGTISGNFHEGSTQSLEDIVNTLNSNRSAEEENIFYFDVVNGHVVLVIGQQQEEVCEAPTNLQVSISGSIATITWDAPEGATQFSVTSGGGPVIPGQGQSTSTTTVNGNSFTMGGLQQGNSYVVYVKTKCGSNAESEAASIAFSRECPTVSGLSVNNITHETATATWDVSGESTFKVRLYKGNSTDTDYISEQETQSQTSINLSNLEEATQYTLEVIASCNNEYIEGIHAIITFTTKQLNFETAQSGNFNVASTWKGNVVPEGNVANIKINEGHGVIVSHDLRITETYKITENKGILQITQQGQLINTTDANVPGFIEIVAPQHTKGAWTFVGAPFEDGYKLGTIVPMSHDVSVSRYDYEDANWSNDWAHVGTAMEAGEGYFAWPFYSGAITYTTYGDLYDYSTGSVGSYDFSKTPETTLKNEDFTITKDVEGNTSSTGRWMALSNPYPAKLDIAKFLQQNSVQGGVRYKFNGTSWTTHTTGDIAMTEGFFVNLQEGVSTVNFSKTQLKNYQGQAKSQVAPREFINLALVDEGVEVDLLFAYNEESDLAYDIFDANKMFSPVEISEPYFVTDGISLVKEEVNELPYYATMNVRSYKDTVMNFVMKNIPEGLAVSLIDGEQVIDMVEGSVYSTNVATGENADRFKLLVKKNLGIADVEELEVNITNNNRHISIATTETDLQVEVYNALGQKVLSTKDRNFTLNQVSAGAYLIKAFNNKASKTQKIVVE